MEEEPKKSKKGLWLIVLLVIIIVALIGLVAWMITNNKTDSSDQVSQTTTPSVLTSKTLSETATKTTATTATAVSAEGPDDSSTNEIKTLSNHFMQARKNRDLEEARPYLTSAFLDKYDQGSFAGVSSPGVGSFEIGDINSNGTNKYSASVAVHWILGGEPSGDTTWTLTVVKQGDEYLVDDYTSPM